jgi:hypothetical protein
MNNQPKVSAQELMAVVTSTNNAADTAVKISCENSKSIAELTKKIDALQTSVTLNKKWQGKPASKATTVLMIVLMIIGLAMAVGSVIPQITECLFITTTAWQWIYIGYALFTVIAAVVVNVKMPIKVLSALFAIVPMTTSLIISIL